MRPTPASDRADIAPTQQAPQAPPGARAAILLFLIVIAIPGAGLALGFSRATISEAEMRELAVWPAWSWRAGAMKAWPDAFQKYFEDHFLGRNHLIVWRAAVLWNGLGTAASDQVVAGRDGWLFYAADGGLSDWTQAEPFTPDELAVWRETLVRRRAFLQARGIRFLFVVAPDKQMIYPEFMPSAIQRLRADYRADQLIAYMRATTPDFEMLDLRPSLRAAKPSELLYHRYDTHWNDRGALVGYQTIARRLAHDFPVIQPLQREDFDADPAIPSGDKTTMLGLTDPGKIAMPGLTPRRGYQHRVTFPEQADPYGEVGLLVTEHRDATLPTMMMFRDSFAGRLIPYLSEHFSRATYFWQNELDFDAITREKPDVVVQEFVARHFFTYVPYPGIIPR